ncbi:CRISPR-associated protein Cas6 [Candidatus Magnetomorum sp. HK-1]|nr:CRISPR-associated protein Cas6 [Candidatus Magnetomorum sp. HK-1]
MIFGNYRFSNIFLNNGILPIYKGSTFRGGFGHALKNIICTSNELLCNQCMLAKQCVYVRLFEPQHLKINLPEVKQMSTLPSPFVIEPPYTQKTHFSTNDAFDFNLLLFGDNNQYLPYFIYAFDQMGKTGVGKHIDGHRGQFKVQTVKYQDTLIYSDEMITTDNLDRIETLSIDTSSTNSQNIKQIKIVLDTPLRFKINRKLSTELTFDLKDSFA